MAMITAMSINVTVTTASPQAAAAFFAGGWF
jgi:hypothetical protein